MIHNLTMKKKFVIILCVVFLLNFLLNIKVVNAENYIYARIMDSDTCLYSSNTFDENSVLFTLERTYFVKIITSNPNYLKVKYFSVNGYVRPEEVEIVNGIPNKPYPENITFNINSPLNLKIRLTPTMKTEDNVIAILPKNDTQLNYIASTVGEESIKNMGTKWYYCSYTYSNNSITFGYVYAPLTENLTKITLNTETFEEKQELTENEIPNDITERQNLIIVVLLCSPAILIIILLVVPLNKKSNSKTKEKNKTSKKKSNKDYYEID